MQESKQIFYKKGYKYQTVKDSMFFTDCYPDIEVANAFCKLRVDGTLFINKGYAWDGPSGPTIDTNDFMRGSLVHDALYQLMTEGLLSEEYKDKADIKLYNTCIEDGMWELRAGWVYVAVSKLSGNASKAGHTKEVLVAPKDIGGNYDGC